MGQRLKIGSLCTGYGGLDMAVEAFFKAKTVWCAEFDKHASKLIEERFNIPNYGDIKNIDWAAIEPIDILTAGYPCQPFSHAGSRKGTDDERHIFPYILEAISILKPRWIILENVRGHLSLGLKEVLEGLASKGYDAKWQIVRASDVGAPHQRARLFIVAYPTSLGWSQRHTCRLEQDVTSVEDNGLVTDSNSHGHEESRRTSICLQSASEGLRGRKDQREAGNEYRFSFEMDRQEVPDTLDQGKLNPVFVEYMMGLPKGWVTDIDLLRSQKLKMLGNGVVPQQAYRALELLTSVDN
jgi:DNA (cytosine-5)-methyltransferase 1